MSIFNDFDPIKEIEAIINSLHNETKEETEARRAINKARRESRPDRVISDRQRKHKDTGMNEGDFL